MIVKGDGSWQEKLDSGRCPKCGASIDQKRCTSCGLVIIDSKPQSDNIVDDTMPSEWENTAMYETRLEPTEDQIFADAINKKQILWPDAVTVMDKIVREKLEYMEDYPEYYSDEEKQYLEAAWNRILRG
jgi:rubredoxin